METVALGWVLARAARLSSEWSERPASERVSKQRLHLLAVAVIGPLIRPEGALASLIAALGLAIFPAEPSARAAAPAAGFASFAKRNAGRLWGTAAVAAVLVPSLLNWIMTGRSASATAVVKWLPLNPYYGRWPSLVATVRDNAETFVNVLLDGKQWSAVFVPTGARPFALLGLASIPLAAFRARRHFRGALIFGIALAMLLPCTYLSFLWNRLRYLWPFAFAWFIGLACLAASIREAVLRFGFKARGVDALVAGAFAGALASHLPWTLDDLANSASAIDRQQVTLGEWAARELPPEAKIGVNDTGAIAYLGEHKTFDVVGLTTPSEADQWVAGAGSRFEHYERLAGQSPLLLPTHFIVYPHWMACDVVLGRELERATVTDQTILGGTTMVVYEARWDLLQSGARPLSAELDRGARLVDELDVADLVSEREHEYVLGPNAETDDVPLVLERNGRTIAADGARVRRSFDRFSLHPGTRGPLVLVARLSTNEEMTIDVRIAGRIAGSIELDPTNWDERAIAWPSLPDSREMGPAQAVQVELAASGNARFGVAHYWLYEPTAQKL
jgi:hypothetical protein